MKIREKRSKEEQRILERTKEALLYEVEKGSRDMRIVDMKLTEILDPLHDIRWVDSASILNGSNCCTLFPF